MEVEDVRAQQQDEQQVEEQEAVHPTLLRNRGFVLPIAFFVPLRR
jgi:hypothetical protein